MKYDDIIRSFSNPEMIGKGGQKVVFAVDHEAYGHSVLKIGHYRSERTLERIRREFAILNSLNSPHFPKCYEMKVVNDHRFIVLEQKLPGTPLADKLDEFREPRRALQFIINLVNALDLLWQQRVIHRDVKPANVLVGENDHVFVIDLGIARLLDEVSLTDTFAQRGPCTPVYAAPEQLLNRKHEINHRCDQFAVAIVFAQLLLGGRHPFDPRVVNDGESTVENILHGRWASAELESLVDINPFSILRKMLAVEPHGRYRTPQLLKTALDSIIDGGIS